MTSPAWTSPKARRTDVKPQEHGQALAEFAMFAILPVILALGLLAFIPVHRARTAATSAAYACAQFIAESPNPAWAAYQAEQAAWRTLEAGWSGTGGTDYDVQVMVPSGPGSSGGCVVFYLAPTLFGGLLGIEPAWSSEWFYSNSEQWKARWR